MMFVRASFFKIDLLVSCFGESLQIVQDHLDSKNFYLLIQEFDIKSCYKCDNQ